MKISNKIFRISACVLFALSIVLAYLRISMLTNGKIDALGLYTDRAYGNGFTAAVFVLAALAVGLAFILTKNNFGEKKTNVFVTISSALCMLLLITTAIAGFHELATAKADVLSATGAQSGFDIFTALEAVFALASAVFFLGNVLNSFGEKSFGGVLVKVFPVIYLAVRVIDMFMDITTQINSSARAFTTLFLAVTMMFFISNAEFSVPLAESEKTAEAVTKRYAKYIGFGMVSGILAVIFVAAPLFVSMPELPEITVVLSDLALAVFAVASVLSAKIEK